MEFLEQDYFEMCADLQDYIFTTIEFMKKEDINFSKEVLLIFNEEVIELGNENTEKNYDKLCGINTDINDYIEECASDSCYEEYDKLESFIKEIFE